MPRNETAGAPGPKPAAIPLAVFLALDLDDAAEPEAAPAEIPAAPAEQAAAIFPTGESFFVLLSYAAETAFNSETVCDALDWPGGED